MNIYPKILVATLPLVFCMVLSTVGTTYYFSRKALTELADSWLDTRLSEAIDVAADQQRMLQRYGLEGIPASIAKAKLDAGRIMSAINVGESGAVFAVSTDGIIVSHPDAEMIGENLRGKPWFDGLRPGHSRLVYPSKQGPCLAVAAFYKPWGWYIVASDPEAEVYGVARRMAPYLAGLGITGFLVMAGVLMLLARRLTEPLRQLTVGAEKIGEGKLDTHIQVVSRDEFGRLADVFNRMAGALQKTMTTLKHREAHFRSMIENATDLIIILDAEGKMTYVSPSTRRILGYAPDSIRGGDFFDLVHPDEQARVRRRYDDCRRQATPSAADACRLRHADGSWRILEATGNNLLDDPAVSGVVINARDITKRKAAEAALQQSHQQLERRVAERTAELKATNRRLRREIEDREQMSREKDQLKSRLLQSQKMEAIGTLAGGIAHDFNNLLMGIQGNIEMMALDLEDDSRYGRRFTTIQDCIKSGKHLTRQLLGFARLGKYEVRATNPNDLIDKCTALFGRTRQELRIVTDYQADVWTVNVDRGQIEQVLLNLLINAWQAMPEGGTISIETANESLTAEQVDLYQVEPGNYVKIAITDNGIGMDPETMERIFDPFFTTKAIKRGTGLGLASAYGIVKNHGGGITVSSRPGEGATFSVHLKASDAPVAQPAPTEPSLHRGTETILIVDDDAMIIDVGKAMLSALGYTVHTADSGRSALNIYDRQREVVDLVILDLIMPDMGGGQTFDALKQINPAIKVLLASGYSISGQASDILKRGCNGFIQKPFNLQELSEKVRTILDMSPA